MPTPNLFLFVVLHDAVADTLAADLSTCEKGIFRDDGQLILDVECFDYFENSVAEFLSTIENAIDTGNARELNRSSHKFKGVLQNLSAQEAIDKAYVLERMGRDEAMESAAETFKELVAACERLKYFIAHFSNV